MKSDLIVPIFNSLDLDIKRKDSKKVFIAIISQKTAAKFKIKLSRCFRRLGFKFGCNL